MIESISAALKTVFRNRQNIFWGFAFPMLFVLAFSLFKSATRVDVRAAVLAPPDGPAAEFAKGLEEALVQSPAFTLRHPTEESAEDLRHEIELDRLDIAVIVKSETRPDGSPRATVEVLYDESEITKKEVAFAFLGSWVDGANLKAAGIEQGQGFAVVDYKPVSSKTVNFFDFTLSGFIAYGVASVSVIGIASALTNYRNNGILRRLAATPVHPSRFLVANVFSRLVQSFFQVIVIIAFAAALGAHIYGNPVWAVVLVVLGNVVFLNIGLALAGIIKGGPEVASAAGTAVTLPMFIISGAFFPVSTLPSAIRALAWALPMTPLVDGTRKILIEGFSLPRLSGDIALLAVWVVVSSAAAIISTRRLLRYG
jgi:ABC-2 type transport system permease protein